MKLRSIIINSLWVSIYTIILGCSVCNDLNINLYKKNNGGFTPPFIEKIYGNRDDILLGSGITVDYFKKKYKKTNDGQIIEKEDTLFDTDDKGNRTIYKIYSERPYSANLFGNFNKRTERIVEYSTVVNGYMAIKCIQISRMNNDTFKIRTMEVCNSDLHGNMFVFNKEGKKPYITKFKSGSGYWKDFHYIKGIDRYPMKEEGEVKNNFKLGEWKYYNKEGKIDSIKTYTLKDSVDVRFPLCVFNKNEPCY